VYLLNLLGLESFVELSLLPVCVSLFSGIFADKAGSLIKLFGAAGLAGSFPLRVDGTWEEFGFVAFISSDEARLAH